MGLMIGSTAINGAGIFAGWNNIQKKIKMRDRSLSAIVYDFYVDNGQAILSAAVDEIDADVAEISSITVAS